MHEEYSDYVERLASGDIELDLFEPDWDNRAKQIKLEGELYGTK